ncbi:uncharacterized protein LOC143357540 [Halictus rubicundus]|uniref:uncharacterized protein LOC143357540 n=1 Tax=Halictus rubicundus TaxID=77578 RepID=UPI0040366765
MPKSKTVQTASQCSSSIFPRSKQYELWYIRDRRRKDAEKLIATMVESQETEEIDKTATNGVACDYFTPPFWWGGETARSKTLPVGDINEYAYKKLQESQQDSRKISERLQMDHPKKYMPGVIHQMKNPEDRSMKDILDKADSFKVTLRMDEKVPKNGPPADVISHPVKKPSKYPLYFVLVHLRDSSPRKMIYSAVASVQRDAKCKGDTRDTDKPFYDSDTRWQPVYDKIGFTGTDLELQTELRKLSKPFSHELHKWYSENKPAQFMQPVKWTGKRPIPEMRFSHL